MALTVLPGSGRHRACALAAIWLAVFLFAAEAAEAEKRDEDDESEDDDELPSSARHAAIASPAGPWGAGFPATAAPPSALLRTPPPFSPRAPATSDIEQDEADREVEAGKAYAEGKEGDDQEGEDDEEEGEGDEEEDDDENDDDEDDEEDDDSGDHDGERSSAPAGAPSTAPEAQSPTSAEADLGTPILYAPSQGTASLASASPERQRATDAPGPAAGLPQRASSGGEPLDPASRRNDINPLPPGSVRSAVFAQVQLAPGLHLREVAREVNADVNLVKYHLEVLERYALVSSRREGAFWRFFPRSSGATGPRDVFGTREKLLLSALRQRVPGFAAGALLRRGESDIGALQPEAGVGRTTLLYHLAKLQRCGIVTSRRSGRKRLYALADPQEVERLVLGLLPADVVPIVAPADPSSVSRCSVAAA